MSGEVVLPLLLAMLALQLPLLALARLLRRPLRRSAILVSWGLALLLVAPWLDGRQVMFPGAALMGALPGAARPPGGERWVDPHSVLNDLMYQLVPWELEVRRALAAHRLPFWSDLLDGGSSPWSNPQAQVLSPVAMLARLAPIEHHLLFTLALKVLLAAQGAWLLCRSLGARTAPALLGAAGFALGGGILPWALFPISTTAAFAPWVAAGVVALARPARRPWRGPFVVVALATAALLLSGHPETALASVLLAAGLGLAVRHRRRIPLPRFLLLAGLAGSVGTALAAPQILPFVAVAERSVRAGERLTAPLPTIQWGAGLAGWFSGGGAMLLPGPFSPHAFGEPYGEVFRGPWGAWPPALSAYAGLFALAGAAAALAGRARRRVWALILFAFGTFVLASRFVPLERVLFLLPPLRVPEMSRLLPIGCLALAVAAALGWQELARRRGRSSVIAALAAIAALVPALILTPSSAVVVPAILLVLGAGLLVSQRIRLAAVAIAAALLLDLLPWGWAQLPSAERATFYPRTREIQRLLAEVAPVDGRAVGNHLLIYSSILPFYGVGDIRPHNPLAPRDQLAVLDRAFGFAPDSIRYFAAMDRVEHPLLDFLAVRVVVSNRFLPPLSRLELFHARQRRPHTLWRNPQALPRLFLPTAVDVVPRRQLLDRIGALADARRVLVASESVGAWRPAPQRWNPGAVRVLESTPGHLRLRVGGRGERLLAASLPGPFGWHAEADGRELRTMAVDGAFLGVAVPAGVRQVELRYWPPGLTAGLALAASALAILALLLLLPPPRWLATATRR